MKKLLEYIIKGITEAEDFTIEETSEGDHKHFEVKAKPEYMGLIIGKGGKTIRAIRNLIKVKATLGKTPVSISVTEG